MTKYIASTLSNSVEYVLYEGTEDPKQMPNARASVIIAGGANMADKHFVTPAGVITSVTNEELALLDKNEVFKLHKTNGYLQIMDSEPKRVEDAAADMNAREPASPLVDEDFSTEVKPSHSGKKK
jgi:hypothetical protein